MTSDSLTIRPVREGAAYSQRVEGGNRRTIVPAPGVVIELTEQDLYIRAEALAMALAELGWSVVRPAGRTR